MMGHTSSLANQVNPLLDLFVNRITAHFKERAVSIFKLGSLGSHGGFSLCSDVDVALILDEIKQNDEQVIQKLLDEIKTSGLSFADRLSLFWSSYDEDSFKLGLGRFSALDRLDLIDYGILIAGIDRRHELHRPEHQELVLDSAKFISSFLLTDEKFDQLTQNPAEISAKGVRYFTKFVLFPVRLIFTLDHPGVIGSNLDSVTHFNTTTMNSAIFLPEIKEIVNHAYTLRDAPENSNIDIDPEKIKTSLLPLYTHCADQYYRAILAPEHNELAQKLETQRNKLITAMEK